MAIAALDTNGWIDDPVILGDYIFACSMLANKSQSIIFNDSVMSFQDTLAATAKEIIPLQQAMRKFFQDLYMRYFDTVDAQCICQEVDGRINMYITVIYTSKGSAYSLGRELSDITSKSMKIFEYNNRGVL